MRAVAIALLSVAATLGACRRAGPGGAAIGEAPSDRAVVSLERVTARASASANAPAAATLQRGAELQVLGAEDGYVRAKTGSGEVFVPVGSFESLSDKAAREKRTLAVARFPEQPGRAVEACPILLAPDYGAARWGDLKDGDDVAVLLADHDFYGIRLQGMLAFVPARSIRLLPAPEEPESASPRAPRQPTTSLAPGLSARPTRAPTPPPAAEDSGGAPLDALPAGAEGPVLTTRVEPRYPEIARRIGAQGEIVLKVVVEADGSVGSVGLVGGGNPSLIEAAMDAVKRWKYSPARVDGRAVPVYKTVRIRFSLRG